MKFVQDVRNMVVSHPELVLAYIDSPEFLLDVALVESVDRFLPALTELAEGVDDTRMVACGEAMSTALRLCEVFKAAGKAVPGLDGALGEMGAGFKKKGRKKGSVGKGG